MNLRTSKRRRSVQLVQGAPGNRVIGLALTMSGLSSLTLKTGKTWTGGLKTSGSDDQSPEGWRAQYGKVGQMWRLLIRWGRRRRRRSWKQRFDIFGGSESSAWIKWGTPSWLRVHGEIEDRRRDVFMHRRQIWGRSKVGSTALIDEIGC